jgi:hypothetical protein
MDPIQAAIEDYESQGPGEQSVQEVVDNHGVWRSTMQRRMDGQIVPMNRAHNQHEKAQPTAGG